ncbi:MaoC family dehydratase [Pseudolysobacter antarcticus]|uniref:MaoC family dehydratase n=1 Tax=Pseudolysobacter antarcticus TaxID=2511995 RepID=A0A411HPJ4_9GAMM|nr:MaoC family dehydratase [Pseudolysobacter antarcticus]QBB72394.1 MaoC family dehydratase [Pseudolysobacter antarcticus]
MQIIENLEALSGWIGREVACSDWLAIDQQRIQRFAEATGDTQWIHVDPERARRESPYQSTIAHGYLTLSLIPILMQSCVRIDGIGMAINYGLDHVRLPAPVRVNERIRARIVLDRIEPVSGGIQVFWSAIVEIENGDKPACVAQMLVRYYAVATAT